MDKIIFFHMNQLGDLLFSLPVLKAAKEEQSLEIISVVKPSLSPLLTESGLVSKIISKDRPLNKLIADIKNEKAAKAVLFSESPNSLLAAYFSGIKERTGFKSASFSFLLTRKADKKGVPSLYNNRVLGMAAGLKNINKDYTEILKIPRSNTDSVDGWLKENNIVSDKIIAVSTGASKKRKDKCLDEQKWVEIIDVLSAKGYVCVLSGAFWEKGQMQNISALCKSRPAVFAAENGILDSAAFLKKASMFLGIDSGAMHLAAAVGTKCVGIFGNTDPLQVGPMPLEKHVIIKKNSMKEIMPEDILSGIIPKD